MVKMIIQVLILMVAAVVGGILYGLIMTQIDLYQMKARGRTKVK